MGSSRSANDWFWMPCPFTSGTMDNVSQNPVSKARIVQLSLSLTLSLADDVASSVILSIFLGLLGLSSLSESFAVSALSFVRMWLVLRHAGAPLGCLWERFAVPLRGSFGRMWLVLWPIGASA